MSNQYSNSVKPEASSPFWIKNRLEVFQAFRQIQKHKAPCILTFDSAPEVAIRTDLLTFDINQDKVIIDSGVAPEGFDINAVKEFILISKINAVEHKFVLTNPQSVLLDRFPAWSFTVSAIFHKLQRREFFRLDVRSHVPQLRVHFGRLTKEDKSMGNYAQHEINHLLFDISLGGMGIVMPQTVGFDDTKSLRAFAENHFLIPNEVFFDAQILLPDHGPIHFDFRVCHIRQERQPQNIEHPFCLKSGCQFLDLSTEASAAIQRYINSHSN